MISVSPLTARRLSRIRATNPELSAGKANVIAIIASSGLTIRDQFCGSGDSTICTAKLFFSAPGAAVSLGEGKGEAELERRR